MLLGEIARRSRGTPRIANGLLRRVREFAQVLNDGTIDICITQHSLKALNVDEHGLDEMDNRILSTIIEKFKGGPVGITTIATAVVKKQELLEEVYEPFLIQEGFLQRTPRMEEKLLQEKAYRHLGKDMPKGSAAQFIQLNKKPPVVQTEGLKISIEGYGATRRKPLP